MKFNRKIRIDNFIVSDSSRTYVIAEAGVNHGGDMYTAKKFIIAAKKIGADAIKFQAFKTENLILKTVLKAQYQTKTTDKAESQFDMLKKLEISKEQVNILKKYCKKQNITFLITPFDEESLDEMDDLGLKAYKISSTDLTNLPFLRKVAKKMKPIILSTGMSYLSEIELALREIHRYNKNVILLQCSANYPIMDNEVNLKVIKTFQKKFNVIAGYSDHSMGIGAAPYAVALGAKVIEKHFTLDNRLKGPDHKASVEPKEFARMVLEIRRAETFLGNEEKKPTQSEQDTRKSLQKYIVAKHKIEKGDIFTLNNITAKRTGGEGISPINTKKVIGKIARKSFSKNSIIKI